MVVECTSIEDLIAVLHEGNKNRRIGCHEMNKDSSRSHSLLNVYIISEIK
jgi:kinesin family protein 12